MAIELPGTGLLRRSRLQKAELHAAHTLALCSKHKIHIHMHKLSFTTGHVLAPHCCACSVLGSR